jgi:methanogenic corrinoid protein MtbC1
MFAASVGVDSMVEMSVNTLDSLAKTVGEVEDSGRVRDLVNRALSEGVAPVDIVERGLRRGMDTVGKKYEAGEYFLSELLYAGDLVSEALEVLKPLLRSGRAERKGVIVIGTVRGDIHDIGKNVFSMLCQVAGFEVHDLGVDVAPEVFIKKLGETGASVLGLSTLLTNTRPEMKAVVDMLRQSGMRSRVKVLLGGNAVTRDFAGEIGADAAALDAVEGVELCKRWVERR